MILFTWNDAAPFPAQASDFAGPDVENQARFHMPDGTLWALAVVDMATGKLANSAGNGSELLVSGSLVKLITTGALLEQFGNKGNLNMKTTLSHDGIIRGGEIWGNLCLTGRGNALLTVYDLQTLGNELTRMGVRKIDGAIIVNTTLFETQERGHIKRGATYAPAGALGLDLHTVAITVSPTTPGSPPAVHVDPANDAARLAVEARTVACGRNTLRITRLDDLSYSITGNIPPGSGLVRRRFPLAEPALYAGGVLRTVLKEKKIAVTGEVRKGKTPSAAKLLAEIPSPDLRQLLHDMNVNSLNVVADNLFLILGEERFSPPGTQPEGVRAVREFLDTLGLPLDGARIADGSGLSEENRISADFMTSYLQKISRKPWFRQFIGTLPRAGIDGTVREIDFRDARFRVKTGSLPDAFALAGYGVDGGGRKVAFAFIANHPGIFSMDAKRAGAEVMRFISTEVFQ